MTINDLSHEQKIGLVALTEAIVMANSAVSEGEARQISKIAGTLGDEEYRKLLEEADSKFADVDSLKDFLKTIQDKPARELIFGTAWAESMADPVREKSESGLLDWLADTWNIPK